MNNSSSKDVNSVGARAPAPRAGPIYDLIAKRAYLKWKNRGCTSNTALQDWLEAEEEVKAEIRLGGRVRR